MSSRTGRPKSSNPKSSSIKIRLDSELDDALKRYSEKHGIKRTEVIRNGIKMILDSDK